MSGNQCRLCLKFVQSTVRVSDEVEKNLQDKIYLCFGVQIKRDDPITKKICKCCYHFTNSVYEHRIASQENDLKLKREYELKNAPKMIKNEEITQNVFLNNLKLTNNITTMHKSIENLKRKFPDINIPDSCYNIDMDPFVDVLSPPKRKASELHVSSVKIETPLESVKIDTQLKPVKFDRRQSLRNRETVMIRKSQRLEKSRCKKCLKYYSNKYSLQTHSCVPKVFSCKECKAMFAKSSNYKKHLLKFHKYDGSKNKNLVNLPSSSQPSGNERINQSSTDSNTIFNINPILKENPTLETSQNKTDISLDKTETSLDKTETSLDKTETSLDKTETSLNKTETSLTKTETSLNITETSLNKTETTPNKTDNFANKLETTSNKIETIQKKVETTPNKIETIQNKIETATNKLETIQKKLETTPNKLETIQNKLETTPKKPENPPNTTKNSTLNESPGNLSDLLVAGEKVNAFVCLTCNKIFDTLDSLKHHKKFAHKLSLRCDKCPKKFTLVEALLKHQDTHKKKIIQTVKEIKITEESNDSSIVTNTDDNSCDGPLVIDLGETQDNQDSPPKKDSPLKLPQLNVTLKPLNSIDGSTRGRIIARKHTDGAIYANRSSSPSTDSATSLSSSDEDDCKITGVTDDKSCLSTALVPQSNNSHPIEFISTSDFKSDIPTTKVKTYSDDITSILIVDSDSEGESTKPKTNIQIVECTEIISSEDESNCRKSLTNSPIIISANTDDNTSGTSITKVSNEVNYINYLYNKCSSEETPITNGSQQWNLKNLKELVKRIIIPIEVNRVTDTNVTVRYIPTYQRKKINIPLVPWSHTKAIDLNVGLNNKTSKSKQLNNTQLAKHQKATIKVPIPATVNAKLVNGQKSTQFVTKYVPNETIKKKEIKKNKPTKQENIPNNIDKNQRSLLKNVLTPPPITTTLTTVTTTPPPTTTITNPQPIIYTYVPTTPIISNQNFVTIPTGTGATTASTTEPFIIPFQQTINKNATQTIVFQQIDQHQPNLINIAQPFFATTTPTDNNTAPMYLKQQTNVIQEHTEIPQQQLQLPQNTTKQEQMNEVSSSSLNQNDNDGHRPVIRIKSLSELTAKTPEQLKNESKTYMNAFANYVSARR